MMLEHFVKLWINCLLIVLLIVNEAHSNETPQYIKDILADANETSAISDNDDPAQNSLYDFIVIGAGTAGCVAANRLSANPNNTVILLELGGPERLAHQMPVLTTGLLKTTNNYGYQTVPQKHSCFGMNDNICDAAQGRSLGGTSSMSSMIYNRGDRSGFDRWASAGNIGWSYDEVLPYFLRAENSSLANYENSPYHNYSGKYISTEDVKFRTPLSDAFGKACQEAGLNYIDYNNPDVKREGWSYTQATTRNGRRYSAFKAYIEPIQANRPNLQVLPYSLVTKILIDVQTKKAYGVEFERLGKNYTIRAKKEIILSAGALHSPQLLIVSGVGPTETLTKIGVPQVVNLPVGKTLFDNVGFYGPVFTTNTTDATLYIDRVEQRDISKFQDGDPSTIVSTISGYEASAFINNTIELSMIASSFSVDYGTSYRKALNIRDAIYNTVFKQLETTDNLVILTVPYNPKSKGSIWVESSDVKVPPKIDPNYFSNQEDVEMILKGVKEAIRIVSLPAMQAINATLLKTKVPGCEDFQFGTDDYWRCAIRTLTIPRHHYGGTCKMGPASDETSVVDADLKVHGIDGLRVVDSSAIPETVAGHTEAIAYMIGEKGSDIIINAYA
ncbi:glucose dehydrogenase [FAD, quinone]-like [Eupeodes corollae]|uniref:glucose dehydrogenase [FAD, quinone]-like n=1 Tax=Eupeodes corollae TaxID=290404 RepID=UPI00248FD5F1|nr:glucose dehydrogenase [FAD, quinone]-like [Eupeodes corollae]